MPARLVAPAPLEPVADPAAPASVRPGRLMAVILVTALLAGGLAGALGGALGYTYAARGGHATPLGAGATGGSALPAAMPPGSVAEIVDRVLPSVVTVRSVNAGGGTVGSGFVISSTGHLITNDHVLGPRAEAARVTFHDGSESAATVVGRDAEADVAVLLLDRRDAPAVEFGDSDSVQVGDPVLAVGAPLALPNTVTSGIVSAVDRAIHSSDPVGPVRYYAAIQTDAAVNQGNSGGPLVDQAGRVIGINSVIKTVSLVDGEAANIGLAFAIPIGHAKRVAQELIDTGEARRTVIGAELDREVGGADGVRLTAVAADGPAEQAGLQAGDVLIRFDGRPLAEPTDLIALVRKHPPGTAVTVEFTRGTSASQATVTLVAATE